MQYNQAEGQRWRVLFIDGQGRVMGTTRPLSSQTEAEQAAQQGIGSFPGTAAVEIVQIRRRAEPEQKKTSSLIIP